MMNPSTRTSEYLKQIQTQKWSGPYKNTDYDYFSFYSLNETGDNKYYVRIVIMFVPYHEIQLSRCLNDAGIAPGFFFKQEEEG